jgi:CheY-like chemotaxis protein
MSPGTKQFIDGAATTHRRVLLVDDQYDTTRTLSLLLRASGYQVETAATVASALELAAAKSFDIMVSDIGLPDATGYELMEQIRSLYGIKGIALTGHGMDDDLRQSRESGFAAHVLKPVDVEELEKIMARLLTEPDPSIPL